RPGKCRAGEAFDPDDERAVGAQGELRARAAAVRDGFAAELAERGGEADLIRLVAAQRRAGHAAVVPQREDVIRHVQRDTPDSLAHDAFATITEASSCRIPASCSSVAAESSGSRRRSPG